MAENETTAETPVSKVIANILKAAREQPKQPKPEEVAKVVRRIYPEKTANPDAKQARADRIIENAKHVVAEARTQGVHVSTGLHEWVGQNRLPVLDEDSAQAFRIAKTDLAVAIKASDLPEDHWVVQAALRVKNAESAEALAIIALAPKDVRENPNFIFQTAAQLAGSNLDPETQITTKTFVEKLKDLRDVDGFNMSDIQLYQALTEGGIGGSSSKINYQFSEDEIDKIKDLNLQKLVRDHNNQMKFITTDASGALRKDVNNEEILYELQQFKQHLREGLGAEKPLNEKETRFFYDAVESLEQEIRQQTQQLQAEAEKKKYIDFRTVPVPNGKEFFNVVDQYRGRLSVVERRAIQERYQDPKFNKEKGEFCDELEKSMRLLVGALESNDKERWRLMGISDLERQLNEYHDILNGVDLLRDREMMEEIHARQWEHDVSHAIRTSASPQFGEIKEFLAEFGQLSEIGFFDTTLRLPGVSTGLRLLERHAEELIASEMTNNREDIMHRIAIELENDKQHPNLKLEMGKTGMTSEAALRLADRHFMLTGRDGEHYKEYIHKHNLIEYVNDRKGHKIGIVKETAPMFWNFFRLLYCPEAQFTFFHMGADMTGQKVELWRNGQAVKNVQSGLGLGAEYMYSLLKNHFTLDLDDFYTRRHKGGYLTNAWGFELFDKKNSIQYDPRTPADKKDPYWKFTMPTELGKVEKPSAQADFDDLHKIWYSELEGIDLTPGRKEFRATQRIYLKALVGKDFAVKMGMTPEEQRDLWPGKVANGVVTWEAMDNIDAWDVQREKLDEALKKDGKLNPSEKQAIKDKVRELDESYRKLDEERQEFNKQVKEKQLHVKGPLGDNMQGVTGYEKEQFMDLSKADLSKMPHTRILRLAEIARGNIRDHVSGLNQLLTIFNIATNPSLQNFNQLDVKNSTVYMSLGLAQAHLIAPAYQALCDVQRGQLPFGLEIYSIPKTRSKYGQVYHVKSLTDGALYKFGLTQVAKGNMTMDQLIHVRGGHVKHAFEELGRNVDFGLMAVVLFAAIQKELEKIEKEQK